MRTTIIIERRHENHHHITVAGQFGGGYQRHLTDYDNERLAALASSEMLKYAQSNPGGGDLVAPDGVIALVPRHLRSIPAQP